MHNADYNLPEGTHHIVGRQGRDFGTDQLQVYEFDENMPRTYVGGWRTNGCVLVFREIPSATYGYIVELLQRERALITRALSFRGQF